MANFEHGRCWEEERDSKHHMVAFDPFGNRGCYDYIIYCNKTMRRIKYLPSEDYHEAMKVFKSLGGDDDKERNTSSG